MAAVRLVLAFLVLAAAAAPGTAARAGAPPGARQPQPRSGQPSGLRAVDALPAAPAAARITAGAARRSVAAVHGVRLPVRSLPTGAPAVPRTTLARPDLGEPLPFGHADACAQGALPRAPSVP